MLGRRRKHDLAMRDVLEAAERGLADAERIIEARTGPGSWVGSLILWRVRHALAGDLQADSQRDAIANGDRIRSEKALRAVVDAAYIAKHEGRFEPLHDSLYELEKVEARSRSRSA